MYIISFICLFFLIYKIFCYYCCKVWGVIVASVAALPVLQLDFNQETRSLVPQYT
jgi:hypothetical protein